MEQNEKTNNGIENDIIEMSSNVEETKSMLMNFNSSFSNNQQSDGSIKNVSDEVIKKVEKNIVNQFNNLATKVRNFRTINSLNFFAAKTVFLGLFEYSKYEKTNFPNIVFAVKTFLNNFC